MKYGLIGGKLGHSYSKIIHEMLMDEAYDLVELTQEQLPSFLKQPTFHGINVTIPYKEAVLPFLTIIDPSAQAIGSVNTIVNHNGALHGHNTDYDGFHYLLDTHHVLVRGSKVVILGSGGTSKTVQRVMIDAKAKEVIVVSRSKGENSITYEQLDQHYDADIIVNTTPVGMYPKVDESPIDLSRFHAHTAIDVIYNPYRTMFLQQAAQLGMKAIGGLEMLVAQAVYASQYFHSNTYDPFVIDDVYKQILHRKVNLVLIGMPGCGKTTIGKRLGELTGKQVIDIDCLIEEKEQRAIRDIFAQEGETYFRELETQVVREISSMTNVIIATGGGVIKQPANIDALRHNGMLCYIDRDPMQLQLNSKRPLSNTIHDNLALFKERDPLYRKYCDTVISNNGSIDETIAQLQEVLHEITRY